jgi:hypothetical protein
MVLIALVHPFTSSGSASRTPPSLDAATVRSLDAHVVHSYEELTVTAKPKAPLDDVTAATQRLQADLQRLLPAAAVDPAAARRFMQILHDERLLLVQQHPAALPAYEAAARQLVAQLRSSAVPSVLAMLPATDAQAVNPGQPVQTRPAAPAQPQQPVTAPVTQPQPPSQPAPVTAPVDPPPVVSVDPPAATDNGPPPVDTGTGGGGTDPQVPVPVPSPLDQVVP